MNRRTFICGLTLGTLSAPLAAEAQSTPRIGILSAAQRPSTPLLEAFRRGLRDLGYLDGKTITLEYRLAAGNNDRLPALAAELVRLRVDIIVADGTVASIAAHAATSTIPIVMAAGGDPVKQGLVASLGRPGGNITGLTLFASELSGKRLQLLKEAAPKTTLVAVIWNAANSAAPDLLREAEATARSLSLQLQTVEVRSPADLDAAFKSVTAARPSAFMTLADGMLFDNRKRVAEFSVNIRLPAVFPEREFAEAGGLMAYGPNLASNFHRAATYVDIKILKGAKPGDLPGEQPTKFELVINMKTAKTLGLTIPQSLLLRADDVIQ